MDMERWRKLSPLLDAMLELDPVTRSRSLASLREEDPVLGKELAALLALEDQHSDFLAEPLVAPLPGPRPGTLAGPYRLERLLGEGGMGQVWLAGRADGLYQRRVALKLLRPGLADTNLRLHFTRERQILARLAHPNIARLLDAGVTADGQPYLALEYVDGRPITDYCREHDVPLDARLRMFAQVCEAVSHAHANLIVHRDLKPSNILVTPAGDVRLLDFGIAKLLDGEAITSYCQSRQLDIAARIDLFRQVCEAVSHAHANLIVHRDLKPSNILVTANEEVRLLDFGIAKLLDGVDRLQGGAEALERTGTGVRAFTLHYAAPEQIRGEPVSTMTDVYSLGVVLYELLAGCKPYRPERTSDAAWEEAILAGDVPKPSQAAAQVQRHRLHRGVALLGATRHRLEHDVVQVP